METAINFHELRRRERRKIRSSKTNAIGNSGDCERSSEDCKPNLPTNDRQILTATVAVNGDRSQSCTDSTSSAEMPLSPYVTLLPKNQICQDIHRMASPNETIDSVFYAEKFLTNEQSEEIISWLRTIPDYSDRSSRDGGRGNQTEREQSMRHNGKWTRLKHAQRKVALFDGTLSSPISLPPILQRLANTLVSIGAFPSSHPPNHVLINEYQPGEGIMPHTDGPAYESCTATISLGGSDVIFKLWPRNIDDVSLSKTEKNNSAIHSKSEDNHASRPSLEVILHGKGSLVLFKNDAYLNHCHEIEEGILEETTGRGGICGNDATGGTVVKRGHRWSLTFRCKKIMQSSN